LFSERSASSKPSKDPQPPKLTVPPPTAALGENLGNEDPLDSIHTASQLFHNIQPHGHEPTLLRKHASTSTITRPIRQAQKPQGAQKLYPEPRKFHLTKSTLSAPSQYYVSKTPAQRHRKSRKELAVFAEKTEQSLEAEDIYKDRTNDSDVHVQAAVGNKQDVPESKRARKRPNATAAERKWRTDNWGKPVEPSESAERATKTAQSVSEPSHQWDYESLELAEQLQQIALQEIQTQEKQLNDLSRHRLKTQPKPPKPRQSNVQQSVENGTRDDVMIDAADIDDNSLHVFDTYVRLSGRQDANVEYLDSNTCALQGTSSHKFGILVINENEEEFWETYGEDQESDAELNSDEEDENGSLNIPCSRRSSDGLCS